MTKKKERCRLCDSTMTLISPMPMSRGEKLMQPVCSNENCSTHFQKEIKMLAGGVEKWRFVSGDNKDCIPRKDVEEILNQLKATPTIGGDQILMVNGMALMAKLEKLLEKNE